MKTKYKYIEFVPHASWHDTWEIRNRKSGDVLGYVGYYPKWRQYVSQLHSSAIFNNSCHRDIADFLDQLNEEKKSEAKP